MSKRVSLLALALCAVVPPAPAFAQESPAARPKPAKASAKKPAAEPADPVAELRRTTAISLVSALADDARTFRDPALRARVSMHCGRGELASYDSPVRYFADRTIA